MRPTQGNICDRDTLVRTSPPSAFRRNPRKACPVKGRSLDSPSASPDDRGNWRYRLSSARTGLDRTMPCIHLRELYELCEKHELRISSHDAIRIVCRQCEEQEVCPSSLTDGENVLRMPPHEISVAPKSGTVGQPSGNEVSGDSPQLGDDAADASGRNDRPVENRPR